ARRLGRVIITSRRREYIEASPVEVKPLSVREGVKVLEKRAQALKIGALLHAGDEDLLKCVRTLGSRPLVLEALVRALCDPATNTLKRAMVRVNRMLEKDLGTFLFDDAWQRLTPSLRHLLLIMVRITDVHDIVTLRLCCDAAGVSIANAE